MILPVIFAALVWGIAMRWRRQWPAACAIFGAVIVLGLIEQALRVWSSQTLMFFWPYAAVVILMGGFIALLPRRARAFECLKCFYDLRGLEADGLVCPECGTAWCGPGSGREPVEEPLVPMRSGPPKSSRAI